MFVPGRNVAKVSGYAPALPTPFDRDEQIDCAAFEAFCSRQIDAGATALVVCGTTGEAPTLSTAERREPIRIAAGAARGRVPVIAGTGSNSTAHAIELTRDAENAGASVLAAMRKQYSGCLVAHEQMPSPSIAKQM